MKRKAIVIGAGIGGLSISARLLKQGFDVEIFEKNISVGGKTNFIECNNFHFDLTASIAMFPNDYKDIFNYCNKNYTDYFSMIPLDNTYKVFYSDDSSYTFYTDLPRLSQTIKTITNNNLKDMYGYFNLLSSNFEKYMLAEDSILNTNFISGSSLFNSLSLIKALKLNPLISCYKDTSKYIQSNKLLNFLLFQSMYVGISPYSSPSIYNIIPTVSQVNGLYHIKGGMYSYIKALEKLVLDLGGTITKSSEVNKILFRNNKAIGVSVGNSEYFSDLVICNSDYAYTINSLIKDNYLKSTLTNPIDLKYSCSTFILYIALNKKYPNLNTHNIYINNDFKSSILNTFNGTIPNSFPLYIYCPSSMDNSLCPDGCETLNILLRVPNLLDSKFEWTEKTIYSLKKKILSTLIKIPELNDLLDHILFTKYLTPLDLERKFNTYGGCAFGLSHSLNQSVLFRPQCCLPQINNLYFTGASTHPGNGVSMVLKSSKICADYITQVHNS